MLKHWKLTLFGLLAYLLFVLILTPASWWLRLAPLPAAVQLGPVSGTLWQGEIQQFAYQQVRLPALSWQLSPWSLLSLTAKAQLQSGSLQQPTEPYLQATVKVGITGFTAENTLVKLPVASILPYLTLPLPVNAAGELMLDIQQANIVGQQCKNLSGQISWLDASLQPPTGNWLDLKQLNATLSCEAGLPVLTTDPENVLSLAVRASVTQTGNLRVQGSLKPDASLPAEVHQAMRFVGQPDANGRYSLNF